MSKAVLSDVYKLLHSINAVRSESEFSKDWLGRSDCYYAHACASSDCLQVLAVSPYVPASCSTMGSVCLLQQSTKQLGQRFVSLSNACHRQINAQSNLQWMTAL